MNWNDSLFLCSGITGVGLLIIWIIVSANTPKKINEFYGYRTKRSMRSQAAWDLAQLHSNRLMVWVSIFNIGLGLLGLAIGFSTGIGITISLVGLIISLIYVFLSTEKRLKEQFSE